MLRISSRIAVKGRRWCVEKTPKTTSVKDKGFQREEREWEQVDQTLDMRPPLAEERFEVDIEIARKRLKYQSSKRGMLEMDAILGQYATDNIDSWDVTQLKEWHNILREYDINLYGWLVKRDKLDELPDTLKNSALYSELTSFVNERYSFE
eukprot:TRINITY_DN25182_c0_g1_i1.p1 TRINITY_DN25182_c0_g1~~TRINITY_DN25182_c0_g1_i1.p1  ORF type:complete len:166 (+),score=30.42 TRINITY_DN25182_c0_g1_i1:47-499(+)